MRVIGLVGLPGSGKSEAASVAREEGIPVITMGDVIREECRDRGMDPAEHHGEVARALREEGGPAAIAERSLPLVEAALEDAGAAVIDGIRSDAEVERFREAFGDGFVLVRIEAPDEARAERVADRGRDDPDAESLAERDEREIGFGMGEAMAMADVTIANDGTLDAFHERIRGLLE